MTDPALYILLVAASLVLPLAGLLITLRLDARRRQRETEAALARIRAASARPDTSRTWAPDVDWPFPPKGETR